LRRFEANKASQLNCEELRSFIHWKASHFLCPRPKITRKIAKNSFFFKKKLSIRTSLKDPALGLTATTHERNLYQGVVRGETVYICHQVDDFSIASDTRETADYIVSIVSSHATTTSQGIGEVTEDGAHCWYNGVDIWQTRNFVKILCETYIDCLLQTHNWSVPATNESDRHDCIPLSSDNASSLQQLQGPMEGTPEHAALELAAGFAYRQVLGELIYAYVVCRLDIGFAVTFLARFAAAPALEHYQALKTTCKYLRSTKS
jgi:hypothetical protein